MSDAARHNRIKRQMFSILMAAVMAVPMLAAPVTAQAAGVSGETSLEDATAENEYDTEEEDISDDAEQKGASDDAADLVDAGLTTDSDGEHGSITYEYELSEVDFRLYAVGSLDSDGNVVLDEPYNSYGVEVTSLETDDLLDSAKTLADYVTRDELTPIGTEATDENGEAYFSDLAQGVYLLIGEEKESEDGDIWVPVSTFISIPSADENGDITLDAVILGKHTTYTPTTEVTVEKIWRNDTSDERPAEITVQLLEDGELYGEMTLNEEMNWKYTWTELDSSKVYTVVEKDVPDGYSVQTGSTGTEIIVVNTKDETPPDETTPEETKPGETTPSETTAPDETTPSDSTPHLPQTGQLWWPVLMMTAGGLFLILVGLLVRTRKRRR